MSLTLPCSSRAWYSFSRRWFPMWKDLALAEDSMMMARLAKTVFIFLSGVVLAPAFRLGMSQPVGLPAPFCVFISSPEKRLSLFSLSERYTCAGGWVGCSFWKVFFPFLPSRPSSPSFCFFMATRNSKSFCLMGRGKILSYNTACKLKNRKTWQKCLC